MNYVKKMCVLRQVKQGFSGDGKTLSGLVKLEQYGKNLAAEISIINFAPLSAGEYYCLLCDLKGVCEMLPLRSKRLFNIITDLDISDGFCAVICFVKNEISPIAYGINGNATYNWRSIINALPFAEPFHPAPAIKQEKEGDVAVSNAAEQPLQSSAEQPSQSIQPENTPPMYECKSNIPLQTTPLYDDENVAEDNYYESKEEQNEPYSNQENCNDAPPQGGNKAKEIQPQTNATKNVHDQSVLDKTPSNTHEYYLSIQRELDELFKKYPRDKSLEEAFTNSEWVRVKGDKKQPLCLVGIIYEELKPKYICYALPAEDKDTPPAEIKDACVFVPKSPYDMKKGFFVIFQNASTGITIANPQ